MHAMMITQLFDILNGNVSILRGEGHSCIRPIFFFFFFFGIDFEIIFVWLVVPLHWLGVGMSASAFQYVHFSPSHLVQ